MNIESLHGIVCLQMLAALAIYQLFGIHEEVIFLVMRTLYTYTQNQFCLVMQSVGFRCVSFFVVCCGTRKNGAATFVCDGLVAL